MSHKTALARSSIGIQRQASSSSSLIYGIPIRRIHLTTSIQLQQRAQNANSSRLLRDENIRATRVRLVDPQTNELLPRPFNTAELLDSIDRTRYTLQQVAPGNSPDPTSKPEITKEESKQQSPIPTKGWRDRANNSPSQEKESSPIQSHTIRNESWQMITLEDLPIVKLIDKKEEYEKRRLARKQKQADSGEESISTGGTTVKSTTTLHKEVVLSWQSTTHDIQHKLQPIRANMIKRGSGASCRITIASKKGKGSAVDEQGKLSFLHDLEKFLCDWSNAADVLAEEGSESAAGKKLPYFPRRRGEVVWQKNNRTAILIVEVTRR